MSTPLNWVLITGASSGFGAAAARAFGAAKAKLLLGARRVDRLQQVAASAREARCPPKRIFMPSTCLRPRVSKGLCDGRASASKPDTTWVRKLA